MRMRTLAKAFGSCVAAAGVLIPVAAQQPAPTGTAQPVTASTTVHGDMPTVRQANTSDWPLHNLDVSNRRYSPLNQIDTSNASKLTLKWSYDAGAQIGEITPVVINGVMYFNSGSKLFAIDAATGQPIWTFQMQPVFEGGGRGPTFGDGRIFAFGSSQMYSVDAMFGRLLESFGDQGVLRALDTALQFKYRASIPRTSTRSASGRLRAKRFGRDLAGALAEAGPRALDFARGATSTSRGAEVSPPASPNRFRIRFGRRDNNVLSYRAGRKAS